MQTSKSKQKEIEIGDKDLVKYDQQLKAEVTYMVIVSLKNNDDAKEMMHGTELHVRESARPLETDKVL